MKSRRYPDAAFRLALLLCLLPTLAPAQFAWPVTPLHLTQQITGNFAEFRDTGSADHFHNGTDIPKPDGSPVYPVKSGVVTGLVRTGSNAYVRIEDMAYVHILPRPSLGIGDPVVAGQTILGTILPGQGHVHFTNGYVGSERNSLLPGTGLTPFVDSWSPVIRYIRFYRNGSQEQFVNAKVSGPVEIVVKVDEQNGPPSSSISRRNNGVYKIGYKIMTADSALVEEPPGGIRFQFDTKPSNGWVHNVFSDQLSSTTSHVYLVTNSITSDGAWETETLTPGPYIVMAYATDTQDNADTAYKAIEVMADDQVPPSPPILAQVSSAPKQLLVRWEPDPNGDLSGYRLEFTYDRVTWRTRLDEAQLIASTSDTSFAVNLGREIYFRLRALDDAALPNESMPSDVYGTSDINPDRRILIVDGFDRHGVTSGWPNPWHDMVFVFGSALTANGYGFDTVSNDQIEQDVVTLSDYDAVLWLLGDEAGQNETFSAAEQERVIAFLAQGGKLFVSGSEIASDLDQDSDTGTASPGDEDFLKEYLRVDYGATDAGSDSVWGAAGTIFDGLVLEFGRNPYPVISPDVLVPSGPGTQACLLYGDGRTAGVQFTGVVATGAASAQIITFGFPFETLTEESDRNEVMGRVLNYFFTTTAVAQAQETPRLFQLMQNYPNPFNPETRLTYSLPTPSHITLEIFNGLGRKIKTLVHGLKTPGSFEAVWHGLDERGRPVTSGIYFARLIAAETSDAAPTLFRKTIPMTIVR